MPLIHQSVAKCRELITDSCLGNGSVIHAMEFNVLNNKQSIFVYTVMGSEGK
jgi:hypothetical protein